MESGTSLQQMSDNTLPPLQSLPSPPHHHRRHIRYATPENSAPPQFILEAASTSQRSSSNHHRTPRTINSSPPPSGVTSPSQVHQSFGSMPSPGTQDGEFGRAAQSHGAVPSPAIEGQDHDRMETDEENDGSEGSGSEGDTPEPESQGAENEVVPPPPTEDESMDTSPDNPPIDEPPPPEPPPQLHPEGTPNEAPSGSAGLIPVQVHVLLQTPEGGEVAQTIATEGLAPNASDEARVESAERELVEVEETARELRRTERAQAQRTRREAGEEAEGDEDSDDSSDDEEHPYWVNLKEDTSTPDERELQVIEESGDEVSALDHEHWEQLVHEPLDDPEYVPDDAGRLTWTVKGIHGTAENPNREKIMRSPPVKIGGYYWNIKYFPHGNDGTEQLSIYIECSPTPNEGDKPRSGEEDTSKAVPEINRDLTTAEDSNQGSSSNSGTSEPAAPSNSVDGTRTSAEQEMDIEATPTPPKKSEAKVRKSWGTAAQISCVLYNPQEPRVNVYQKGCHRYYSESPDWGWTRFHGPWDEIHKRQRFQRQALLRNDTLAFTAYIRTIKDDTKALWWHPPKDNPEWDSEAMTGIRALECQAYQSSAMIAAVSSWMHLKPIQQLIRNMEIPDPVWEACKRMRPGFEELQDLYDEGESTVPSQDHSVSLRGLVSILNFYCANVDSKMDVVKIWETLRRVLNFEASGLDNVKDGNDPSRESFKDILVLKQPDLLGKAEKDTEYQILPERTGRGPYSPDTEPHSVQESLDMAAHSGMTSLRIWQSFEGQRQEFPLRPAILHVELHRQSYVNEARKWQKLTHQIKIDENIVFNGLPYTLYGMIVHSGDLESNEYHSIIRPEGPKTRWIKYAGDNHDRKVSILTSKQAVEAHEGDNDSADSTAAVAYVVLYVRTEELPGVLCAPFKHESKGQTQVNGSKALTAPQEEEMMDSNDDQPDMPVLLYDADSFEGYGGRGMCDPWTLQNEGRFFKELSLPAATTISEVKEHANSGIFKIEKPEDNEIRLWPMNTFITDVGIRAFPSLLSYKAYCEETLDEMGQHSGGCRFWMKIAQKAAVPTPEASVPAPPSEADQAREREIRDAEIQAAMLAIQAADGMANEVSQSQGGESADVGDTEMAGAGSTPQDPERQRQRRQQQQQLLLQMQQAQQQQQQQLAAQQAQQRQREAERNAQQLKETYFLVKIFDPTTQNLWGKASAVVKSESKIVEAVKKLLHVDASEAWDCYHERGIEIDSRDCVRSHETFESKCGGVDGTIIIAQRRLAASE